MTDDDELDPVRRARQQARQDERDRRASLEATRRQIEAAGGRRKRPEPPLEDDTSRWSATDWQVYHRTGRKPLKRTEGDD